MQIELSDQAIAKARQLVSSDEEIPAVIVEALDRLAWERQEVAAVMEGVEAYERGEHRPLEEFGKELRERYGIKTPES